MAYVRSKTIGGKTYRYLVKSVRQGHKVRQVFVSYIGNPPPACGLGGAQSPSSPVTDFTPCPEPEVRACYVRLMKQLGCGSVVFTLRSKHKHGDVLAHRDPVTGVYQISRVRLNRDVSTLAIAHEVGHVLDYVLQSGQASGGSLDAQFLTHHPALRNLADYTCAHHETSSPDMLRKLKRYPESKVRDRSIQKLEHYYAHYVYETSELFARLVSVSLTEPVTAKLIAPAAYEWLKGTLYRHDPIRVALIEVGLWSS